MNIIAKKLMGGGKNLSFLLAGVFALVVAQSVLAATKPAQGFYWTGLSDTESEFNNTKCWYYYNGSKEVGTAGNPDKAFEAYGSSKTYKGFLRSDYDAVKNKTVTFGGARKMYGDLSLFTGTSTEPVIFIAKDATYGLTSTAKLNIGTDVNGCLQISSGTYQFSELNLGSSSGKNGALTVNDGGENKTTITSTGKVSINNGILRVNANGKLICKGWAAAGNVDNHSGTLEIDGGVVLHNNERYLTIGDTASATGFVNIKNGGKYLNEGAGSNGIGLCVGQKGAGTLDVDDGTVDIGTKTLMLCDNTNGKATLNIKNGSVVRTSGFRFGTAAAGGANVTIDGGTLKASANNTAFIPNNDKLNVYIGANGATVDTQTYSIVVPASINAVENTAGDFAVIGGGSATFSKMNLAGAFSVGDGTEVHWFDQDETVVGTCALSSLALGAGATFYMDGNADAVDALPSEVTTTATVNNPAKIEIIFSSMPAAGKTFALFPAESAEVFNVKPVIGGLEIPHAISIEGGNIVLTITAEDYIWNGSQTNWGDDGAWTKGDVSAIWANGNNAVFSADKSIAVIGSNVSAAEVRFTADSEISGEGFLTAPSIVVAPSVSAVISSPISGVLEKTGTGTLTLSKPRTDQTTLSEGTLVMSGDAATVDPAKLTLGTDVEKPVTFDYGGKTFVKDINISGGLDVTVKNGTFSLERVAVGTLRVAKDTVLNSKEGWACVGPSSSSPDASTSSLLDVCGGRVNINTQDFPIGDFGGAESSSEVWVRKGGSLVTVKDILIGTSAAGTLTIDDGTVATASNMSVVFASNIDCVEGRDCVLNLNEGGVLSTATVRYGSGSAKATIFFNGGTFKSLLNNLALIQQPEKITALVKAGGGVIDANGNTVRIDTPLLEDESSTGGGMTFKGGGVVALASGNTYTGKTTVEIGTIVHIPSPDEIKGGLAVALPEDSRDGTYTLLVCDGDGVFTDEFLTKVEKPENAKFVVPNGGKAVVCVYGKNPGAVWIGGNSGSLGDATNWANGAVPTASDNCVIVSYAPATLENPEDSTFAASKITIPSGSAAIKVSGKKFSGITQIANNSANLIEFENEVEFSGNIDVIQNTGAVKFTGGAKGTQLARKTDIHGTYTLTTTDNYTEKSGTVVKSDGVYKLPDGTFYKHLGDFSVEQGGRAEVKKAYINRNVTAYLLGDLKDEFKVTDNFTVYAGTSSLLTHYVCAGNSDNGVFLVNTLQLGKQGAIVPPKKTVIGSEVYRGAGHVRMQNSGSHEFGSYGNWTMYYNAKGSNLSTGEFAFYKWNSTSWTHLTFNTTDYYNSEIARTITSEAHIGAENAASAEKFDVIVKGKGRFIFANTSNGNIFSGGLTVKDTATVEVKKNSWPGKGAVNLQDSATLLLHTGGTDARIGDITVGSTARLKVAESGIVKLGGGMTLEDGATLEFNFTEKTSQPVLQFAAEDESKTVTANGELKIAVSTADGKRPASGKYELTAGGKFSGISVSLAENLPKWARSVVVNDSGDIVLDVSVGTRIIVR